MRIMAAMLKRAEVEFYVHATEDIERIKRGIFENLKIRGEVAMSTLRGHYGNPIIDIRMYLKGDEASKLFLLIMNKLEDEDKATLLWNLNSYIDDRGRFFLRLDKQDLMRGVIRIGKKDAIKLKFEMGGDRGRVLEYIKRWL